MRVDLPAGNYVVAVSGGVDSVVLLHLLKELPGVRLTVAHFDHGIRSDSAEDRKLVQELARAYGLPFVYDADQLGAGASEAVAREARYAFLHRVRAATGADAIVTAHHEDDLLETMILNLLRGTNRRGLSSLRSTDTVRRPLLHVPKRGLLRYAEREGLAWHEDSTNTDERYLRNYIRHNILPRFAESDREAWRAIYHRSRELNQAIHEHLTDYLRVEPAPTVLDRHRFIMLPHTVAREVMAAWLLQNTGVELSRKLLERLVVAAKTGKNGSKTDVNGAYWLAISAAALTLVAR